MNRIVKTSFFSFLLATSYLNANPPEDLDVAIIGAGFAGLSAGLTIKNSDSGQSFHIFEGRDRLGGRAWTEIVDGKPVDRGCELVDADHAAILALLKHYKLGYTAVPLDDPVKFFNTKEIPLAHMQADIQDFYNRLNAASKGEIFEQQSLLDSLNTQALASRQSPLSERQKDLFNALARANEGIDGDTVPVSSIKYWKDNFAEYLELAKAKDSCFLSCLLSCLSCLPSCCSSYCDVEYQYRIDGGTKSLIDAMAHDIGEDRIALDHPLTKLSWNSDTQKFDMQFSNGNSYRARSVIMTIPFSVLANSERHPSVLDDSSLKITPEMRTYIDTMPYGTNSKIHVPGPLRLTYGIDMLEGAVGWADARNTGLNIFLGGTPGREVTSQSAQIMATSFVQRLGITMPSKISPTVHNWFQDPFAKGSYRAFTTAVPESPFDSPSLITPDIRSFSTSLLASRIPFVFAGEHMYSGKTGFMNSAVISGQTTAHALKGFMMNPARFLR